MTIDLMRVGLTFDLRNPPRWRRPWSWMYGHALEVAEESERLGADSIWLTEHHFFEDGYLPQPNVMGAAIAARTQRVRIGTAIMIAPLRTSTQIAEEFALLDLISGGRAEIGLGAGYRVPEFDAFGADVRRRFSATLDRARDVRRLLDEGIVTPPPVQRPVPMWLGYRQAKGAYQTGLLGEGLQRLDRALVEPYREGLRNGGHDPSAARLSGTAGIFVADDPERVWGVLKPRLAYMWDSYHRYSVEGTGRPVPGPIDPERWRRSINGLPPRFQVLTPDDAVAFIRRELGSLPVADLSIWATIAGMPDDLAARHRELLLTEVRPRVAHLGVAVAGADPSGHVEEIVPDGVDRLDHRPGQVG